LEHYENFNPDVIIVDFVDKMRAEYDGVQLRHQLDEMWELLKSLAQERHCLVATASQSNTLKSGKKIGPGSWSESQGKMGPIDIGFAIWHTSEEKKAGIMKILQLKQREGEFHYIDEITVLENRNIGRIYLDSYYNR
jgi:hypothetical protein